MRHKQVNIYDILAQTLYNMDGDRLELVLNFVVTILILAPIWTSNAPPSIMAGIAAFVHSVHVPRAIKAYQQAKDYKPQ